MRSTIIIAAAVLALPGAAGAQRAADAALSARAEAFLKARDAFDQPAIIAMMAPDYVEVSPIGEVDPRDRVIGFYAPEKKVTPPSSTIDEEAARVSGDIGTVTLRLTYALPGKDGAVQRRAMRVGLIARRIAAVWRFTFVQVTPIRERPTPPPSSTPAAGS